MKIDKNTPPPEYIETPTGRGRPRIYPFGDMSVGDSILIGPELNAAGARGAAKSYGYKHGQKFATKKEGDSMRIWRIK